MTFLLLVLFPLQPSFFALSPLSLVDFGVFVGLLGDMEGTQEGALLIDGRKEGRELADERTEGSSGGNKLGSSDGKTLTNGKTLGLSDGDKLTDGDGDTLGAHESYSIISFIREEKKDSQTHP